MVRESVAPSHGPGMDREPIRRDEDHYQYKWNGAKDVHPRIQLYERPTRRSLALIKACSEWA